MTNKFCNNEKFLILQEFKKQLANFLDELTEQFPNEEYLCMARILMENQISTEDIMNHCISNILPYHKMIQSRNENFFLNGDASLFGIGGNQEVDHFKSLWLKLDIDDRLIVWSWFDLFVKLILKYNELNHE